MELLDTRRWVLVMVINYEECLYILSNTVPKAENCAPVVRARTIGCFVALNTPAKPPYRMPDTPM